MARKTGVWLAVATVGLAAAGCGGSAAKHHVRAAAASSPSGALRRELRSQVRNYLDSQLAAAGRGRSPIVVPPGGGPFARPLPGGRSCFVVAGAQSCSIEPCVVYAQTAPAVELLGTVVRSSPPGIRPSTPPCRHPGRILRVSGR